MLVGNDEDTYSTMTTDASASASESATANLQGFDEAEVQAALKASLTGLSKQDAAKPCSSQCEDTLTRDRFVAGACATLQLAIDGTPGVLLSMRALRNKALQATNGNQDQAGRQVAEAMGRGVAGDQPSLVAACLPATGLPLVLALPLWHQLRRVALLSEVLGHDASANRGSVLCAVGGISTKSEPITGKPITVAAAHALWRVMCREEILEANSVLKLVGGLADCEAAAVEAVINCFALYRKEVTEAELQHSDDAPEVSLRGAKMLAEELLKNPERMRRAEARAASASGV